MLSPVEHAEAEEGVLVFDVGPVNREGHARVRQFRKLQAKV